MPPKAHFRNAQTPCTVDLLNAQMIQTMLDQVDYYISAIRTKGEHITHVRVHKALPDKSFAPHGIIQPRSTVIVNLRNSRIYKTLVLEGHRARPGQPVQLVERGNRFYLRTVPSDDPADDLGDMPGF